MSHIWIEDEETTHPKLCINVGFSNLPKGEEFFKCVIEVSHFGYDDDGNFIVKQDVFIHYPEDSLWTHSPFLSCIEDEQVKSAEMNIKELEVFSAAISAAQVVMYFGLPSYISSEQKGIVINYLARVKEIAIENGLNLTDLSNPK